MRRDWSFHAVALASGASGEEVAAKKELIGRLSADVDWSKRCSYRVVGRSELEELVRLFHAEEEDTRRWQEREKQQEDAELAETAEATPQVVVETIEPVAVTPTLLATAFQRLVGRDKQEFLSFQQSEVAQVDASNDFHRDAERGPGEGPVRVYLLVDYPVTLSEIDALLRLGEAGVASKVSDGPESLPLLPLIDGVVLLADPTDPPVPRSRLKSSSTIVERKSVTKILKTTVDLLGPSFPEVSVFQSCSAVVRMFFDAAQFGGVEWSDFDFTHVNCTTDASVAKAPEDIQREFCDAVEAVASQKFAFKAWVAATTFCTIPDAASNDKDIHELLRTEYDAILDGIFPGSIAVSTVLFAAIEAVAIVSVLSLHPTPPSRTYHLNRASQTDTSAFEEFIEYGDLVASRIARAQLNQETLQAEGNPCYLLRRGRRLDDIERSMWRLSDLPGIGNDGRKAMPREPDLSEAERSVQDTELASFYASKRYAGWIIHLTQQLFRVEEMLGNSWRGKLQQRGHIERLSRAILPQRIAFVLQQNMPDVCLSYYAATDALLLACLPKTAPGRVGLSSWIARDHVRHRPAFKDWKSEQLVDPEYLTPRTKAAAGACVPLSAAQLELVSHKVWAMYPADHSVVRIYRTPRGLAWLTVYCRGDIFGLRTKANSFNVDGRNLEIEQLESGQTPSSIKHAYEMQFVGSFQDDSTIHISPGKKKWPKKPDGLSTITMSNSFPNGLTVSACSDGSIAQRYAGVEMSATSTADEHGIGGNRHAQEEYRVIYGKGSVLRVLRCGRKEVLLASGIIRVIYDCAKRRLHAQKRFFQGTDVHPPLVTTLTLDPETNALVERRPDGVIITTLTSGARATYHVDGTRMYLNSGNSHVVVKKRGFADVCFDIDVNVTAQRHAAGERVAVTKGGLRARSIVNIYDGTSLEVSYNTKVTAQVNGRVSTRKPSGQVIVAKDSGRVEYYVQEPTEANRNQIGRDSKDDDDRDVTTHNGVYYFDCRHGRFDLCDNEQNQFHADVSGPADTEPTILVNLAGEVSAAEATRYNVGSISAKAVINEPIEPHVFVLNGDGTGVEVLRPRDVADYIDGDNQAGELDNQFASSAIKRHVFLRQMRSPAEIYQQQGPLFNDTKLHEEMLSLEQPVATAGKFLPSYLEEPRRACTQRQFTTVRRIEHFQPLSVEELEEMQAGRARWGQWQQEREMNKECYKVVDPRSSDAIAQELTMQKKVLAAYKATRARKKLARQKAREMKTKGAQELNAGQRMETVQEGEEALGGEGEDEQESDDEFGQFGSDLSDDDVGETVEVDDPMELLWSSFSQADKDGRGLLSVDQARLGIVNVLGIGVTAHELTDALVALKVSNPTIVSFDVFAELVAMFRQWDEGNQAEASTIDAVRPIPALKTVGSGPRMTPHSSAVPAGSAAEAVRARGKC